VLPSLTTLASNKANEYARERISTFGVLARAQSMSASRPRLARPSIDMPSIDRPSVDIDDRLLDRLDPAHQLERLSRFLLRTRRLAALRGQWMYFYTDLGRGNGLAGVNINSGSTERSIRVNAPDDRFLSDEEANLLYVSQDNRLLAYALNNND